MTKTVQVTAKDVINIKTALLIMAAGIGKRFGTGIKQLEAVGANGEIIIDYSVHDAIKSGFNKIIFVIRKDIENDFREKIGERIKKICSDCNVEVKYAFQELDNIPFSVPEGRTKPWGTGHAVLAAKEFINEPFAIINADDYYGKTAFKKMHDYLCNNIKSDSYCMMGYTLKNTLSESGSVTRGICVVDNNNNLLKIAETKNIVKTNIGAEANGTAIDINSYVSMNMWGFAPEFMDKLKIGFNAFFENEAVQEPLTSEFLVPIYVDKLLNKNSISVKMLPTNDIWLGMTYKEDIPVVVEGFKRLIENGEYNSDLYSDLLTNNF